MRRKWTDADIVVLRREYPEKHAHEVAAMLGVSVRRVWHKAFALGLKKSAGYWEREKARLRVLATTNTGIVANQRKPGETPWNKGISYMPGGNIKAGWFRRGNYSKRWNQEDYAIGALRINTDGDFQIKLADGHWESMGRYAWFLKTGRWPRKGLVVARKNDDHFDVRDENLECISRRTLIRRNGLWARYPPEFARLVQLKGAVTRQVHRIEKEHGQPQHQ